MTTLTKKTFKIGLTILSACGLKIEEENQIEAWWQLLKDLDDNLFAETILEICKEKQQWWPTDNIPGMIRTKLKEIKSAKWKEKQQEEQKTKMLEWEKEKAPPPKLKGEKNDAEN